MLESFVNVLLMPTVLFSFFLVCFFFSPGVLSKDFFWLCNEENSNLQQVALKAYSIGLVFKSLLGSEFEPLPHICSFIIYDVL